jgi:chemotaxis protein methyltransferase CheR
MLALSAEEKALVVSYMYARCGIDLKKKEYLVASKVGLECFLRHIDSFQEFWLRLSGQGKEATELQQRLVDVLTTSYSYFYREEEHFQVLTDLLGAGKLPLQPEVLRGWCAGCAGGQEAYTLAMNLATAARLGKLKTAYRLTASDVSSKAIAQARKGRYPMSDYVRLPAAWRKAYCFVIPGGCEVRQDIRAQILFRQENLLRPQLVQAYYDFIFCRNVLIYFDKASSAKLLGILRYALQPGGYLFLGHTEIFNELPGFQYIRPAVYQKVRDRDDV